MLYSIVVPVGAVISIEPVGVSQSGCAVDTVGGESCVPVTSQTHDIVLNVAVS